MKTKATVLMTVCAGILLASKSVCAGSWMYETSTDEMSGKKTETAEVTSSNSLHLGFPYGGGNYGNLIVRKHPQYGSDVIVAVGKGQILCGLYECKAKIKFDNGPVQKLTLAPDSSRDSTIVFAKYSEWVITRLRKAKKILIQLEMYQEGDQVLKFEVDKELIWPKR